MKDVRVLQSHGRTADDRRQQCTLMISGRDPALQCATRADRPIQVEGEGLARGSAR